MPSVKPGESRNDYMARCVPECMAGGLSNKAAVGKCEGMFNSKWQESKRSYIKARSKSKH